MAGRIRDGDIETLKQRVNIADVVGDYVALKRAGVDSLKGLCPFHDERTPSFHVRPNLGYYHCFGCGESGDVIRFVQELDHLTFTEAVERLAAKAGIALTYEEGRSLKPQGPSKTRLFAAHDVAAKFYIEALGSDEGKIARDFLMNRGFDESALKKFSVGYAPQSWDALTNHLRTSGFTAEEIQASGLVSQGNRGVYDRFRGRAMWPIRDTSGQIISFGARKLYESDQGPKYLNSPETPIYHKAQALYGIDLAKRSISKTKRAVIVEGYTDVMACHLAGIEQAVATCGTAFGIDHISVLRRVLGDDAKGEVIFTFDPDEAGQAAALKAFAEEKRFQAQTYVAVAPDGLDPSDLRQERGDDAVAHLFDTKIPMFEFALKQAVTGFDLNSVEGRISALRQAAPIVAGIRDTALHPGYTRELAGILGIDRAEVHRAVREALRHPPRNPFAAVETVPSQHKDPPELSERRMTLAELPRTPQIRVERDALMAMLQFPQSIGEELLVQAVTAQVTHPALWPIRDAIASNLPAEGGALWVERVIHAVPGELQDLARQLVVAPLPERTPETVAIYAREIVISLLDRDLVSLKTELLARMQRVGDPSDSRARRMSEQIMALENARRALRAEHE
ncbi:MAG: DNA primase [Canibacter sp.]